MTRRCLRGACVAALSWDAITSYLQAGARPVFTIGAAAKEHGLHLPMDTDFRQAQWLGNAIASRWPVLVWPPIGYGHYPAFLDFPGSVSVNAATFGATIANILESVEQFQQVTPLIVNTGMSTIAPLEALYDDQQHDFELFHVYRGQHLHAEQVHHSEQSSGGHGDEVETSIMLAIAPDSVDLRRAKPWDKPIPAGPLSRTASAPGYSPDGIIGRPDLASATFGRTLTQAILRDLSDVFTRLNAGDETNPNNASTRRAGRVNQR